MTKLTLNLHRLAILLLLLMYQCTASAQQYRVPIRTPGSTTDNAITRWDGTFGGGIQNSGWSINDSNLQTAGGNLFLNSNSLYTTNSGGILSRFTISASDDTTYSDFGNDTTASPGSTMTIWNEGSTVGSFAQLQLINRSSGVGKLRFVAITQGSGDSDFAVVSNTTERLRLDASVGNWGFDIVEPLNKLSALGDIGSYAAFSSAGANYERLRINPGSSGGGVMTIAAEEAGSGTDNISLTLNAAGTSSIIIGAPLSLQATSELTIASGVITATDSYHRVDTEADGATDDLDTINGGTAGDILVLRAENGARDVVVKDGTNIKTAGDMNLDNVEDSITLIFDGTYWIELARSNNGT